MPINVRVNQNLNFIKTKFTANTNPLYLKNQRPGEIGIHKLINLTDVQSDSLANNAMLFYRPADELFHIEELDLDGGEF